MVRHVRQGPVQVLRAGHRDAAGGLHRHGALRRPDHDRRHAGRVRAAPEDRGQQDHPGRAARHPPRQHAAGQWPCAASGSCWYRRQCSSCSSSGCSACSAAATRHGRVGGQAGQTRRRILRDDSGEQARHARRADQDGELLLLRSGTQRWQGLLPLYRRLPAPRERHDHDATAERPASSRCVQEAVRDRAQGHRRSHP